MNGKGMVGLLRLLSFLCRPFPCRWFRLRGFGCGSVALRPSRLGGFFKMPVRRRLPGSIVHFLCRPADTETPRECTRGVSFFSAARNCRCVVDRCAVGVLGDLGGLPAVGNLQPSLLGARFGRGVPVHRAVHDPAHLAKPPGRAGLTAFPAERGLGLPASGQAQFQLLVCHNLPFVLRAHLPTRGGTKTVQPENCLEISFRREFLLGSGNLTCEHLTPAAISHIGIDRICNWTN